jgi:hypothetical protein
MTAARRRLPDRRASEIFGFEAAGMGYMATVSRFDDGALAEIFLTNNKVGSHADCNARDAAVVCSIALQSGVLIETIRHALMRDDSGRASGPLAAALDVIAAEDA